MTKILESFPCTLALAVCIAAPAAIGVMLLLVNLFGIAG